MIRIIALLVATSFFSLSYADDNVVSYERFLKKKADADETRAAAKTDVCIQNLKPELVNHDFRKAARAQRAAEIEALYGRDFSLLKVVDGSGFALVLDPTDMSSDPKPVLTALKMMKRERIDASAPQSDDVLKVRKYGLLKFHYRMMNLELHDEKFTSLVELKNYCEVLAYSMQNIFHGNPPGQNPVAETFQHLTSENANLSYLERHQLLSSALSGLDLEKAMQVDPYFYIYIRQWYEGRHGRRGLKSESDERIERKIRQIAPQFNQLQRMVSSQS